VSSFHLDAAGLVDGDFFPAPGDFLPASGTSGVPAGAALSWTDPTGGATPDYLFVNVGNDLLDQEANSLDGTLDLGATNWAPPLDMATGPNESAVAYYRAAGPIAGPLAVDSGAILWGTSPFALPGYPGHRALVALGGETINAFEVGTACPGDVTGNGVVDFADVLALLSVWGPCGGCPEDRDGNGVIDFADVLAVLSGWGPCE
jgi:hypothetical protein